MEVKVTNAGYEAIASALASGDIVSLSSYKIGSLSLNEGFTPTSNTTNIGGSLLYSGTSADIGYSNPSSDELQLRVTLSSSVGTFSMGNVGIFDSNGDLFCIGVFSNKVLKTATSGSILGSINTIDFLIRVTNVSGSINFTILTPTDSTLPIINDKSNLPQAAVAPYDVYIVRNQSQGGPQTIATRDTINTVWTFDTAGFVRANLFSGRSAGDVVYFNGTQYALADPAVTDRLPIGILGPNDNIMGQGQIYYDSSASFSVGSKYYCGSGSSAGQLTSAANVSGLIGIAISSNALHIIIGIDPQNVDPVSIDLGQALFPGLSEGNVVYFNGSEFSRADPLIEGREPQAILGSNNNLLGPGQIYNRSGASFTPGTIYYCGTGGSAGTLVTSLVFEGFVALAITSESLLITIRTESDSYLNDNQFNTSEGDVIAFDGSTFELADPSSGRIPIGIHGPNNTIIGPGQLYFSDSSFVAGTTYYCQESPNSGTLSSTVTSGGLVGISVTTSILLITIGLDSHLRASSTTVEAGSSDNDYITSASLLSALFKGNPNDRWKSTESKYGLVDAATSTEVTNRSGEGYISANLLPTTPAVASNDDVEAGVSDTLVITTIRLLQGLFKSGTNARWQATESQYGLAKRATSTEISSNTGTGYIRASDLSARDEVLATNSNITGTETTITLSSSITNFRWLVLILGNNTQGYVSRKVPISTLPQLTSSSQGDPVLLNFYQNQNVTIYRVLGSSTQIRMRSLDTNLTVSEVIGIS